jgi:hypothetical protein
LSWPFSSTELLGTFAAVVATWLAVRHLLRSREATRIATARASAPSLLLSHTERARLAERRAADLLAGTLALSGTSDPTATQPEVTVDMPSVAPAGNLPRRAKAATTSGAKALPNGSGMLKADGHAGSEPGRAQTFALLKTAGRSETSLAASAPPGCRDGPAPEPETDKVASRPDQPGLARLTGLLGQAPSQRAMASSATDADILARERAAAEAEKVARQPGKARLEELLARVVAVMPDPAASTGSAPRATELRPASPHPSPWAGQTHAILRSGTARWVAPGEEVTIAGIRVPGGMLYVGESLKARDGREENCLIDPDLAVAQSAKGNTGLHYWPSYASMTATGRRAFLQLLSGGRCDPSVDIGLVFIFFYGLERRLFIDRALSDGPALIAEVERLLGIYGSNGSFRTYAEAFLSAARLATGDLAPPRPEPTSYSYELPLATRLHIGRLLAAERPIDAGAAFLWVLGSPETRLRTPGHRCFAELEQLWAVRFAERNPGGLEVRPPKQRINASYRAASGTFTLDVAGPHEALPDVASVSTPLQGLRDLLETCMTELEPYSRLLGRRPEAREGLEAAMLLPGAIRGTAANCVLAVARSQLDALLGPSGMTLTTPRALAEGLKIEGAEEGSGQQLVTRLSLMFDHLDVGLEPDRRYGGPPTGADAKVIAFRAIGGAPVAPGHSAFEAARLALEIGVLAAAADGDVTPAELEALVAEARRTQPLEPQERLRLEAFILSLAGSRPRIQAALKRAAALPADRRAAIAGAAVGAVLADGQATAAEVLFLESLHRALQLPREAVHAALHQRAAARDEPVPVAGEDLPPDVPLPPVGQPSVTRGKQPGLRIDQGRLARIEAETNSVSALLADVFADSETTPLVPPKTQPDAAAAEASLYNGLDSRHGRLLAFVRGNGGRVPLRIFEAEARTLRLLPGAALEVINDWGFSNHEETVLEEDGDDVAVPDHLLCLLAPN